MNEIPEFQHKPPKSKNYKEKMQERLAKGDKSVLNSLNASGKKRKGLGRISKKLKKRINEYNNSKPMNGIFACACCGAQNNIEKHHVYGRSGKNANGIPYLYLWVYLCGELGNCKKHKWVHENENEAFKEGWLQPKYRGYPEEQYPNHPRPWE